MPFNIIFLNLHWISNFNFTLHFDFEMSFTIRFYGFIYISILRITLHSICKVL